MSALKQRYFAVHGVGVELTSFVASTDAQIAALLGPFAVANLPQKPAPCVGVVRSYDEQELVRQLSPTARPVLRTPELVEVYEEGERFWLVDDRWGVCEINFLRSHFRSWVIPAPKLSAYRCFEMAVLWPLAQLLRSRGLHLVPAASVAKGQWGALLLSPFGLEPELDALIRNGYRVVGQRWTAVREEDGRFVLLHLPGRTEKSVAGPRPRTSPNDDAMWVDATAAHPQATQGYAYCESIFVAEHGRRPKAHLRELDFTAGAALLGRAWPIAELHPQRRLGQLPRRLAKSARCCDVQLSRNPKDLLALLQAFQCAPMRMAG